jgi:hypothetical protein
MQGNLFDIDAPTGAYGQPVEPAPARGWATVAENIRWDTHKGQILARLMKRPATNGELAAITHRFGARIQELREEGVPITTNANRETGEVVYAIAG